MATLEDLVKRHKDCWSCALKVGCTQEVEESCLSNNKFKWTLIPYDAALGVEEYKNRSEVLERAVSEQAAFVSRLNRSVEAILTTFGDCEYDYAIDTEGFTGEYKLLAYGIQELAGFSMQDALTRLPNRRNFDSRFYMEWKRAKRKHLSLSLLMVDIDRFKNYNDNFGHQQGDVALKSVGDILSTLARRPGDLAARWGGEEFVVLLADTDDVGALHVAELVRKRVEENKIPCVDEAACRVTVSVGVVTRIPDDISTLDSFISDADRALYIAKEEGRNRVHVHVDDNV